MTEKPLAIEYLPPGSLIPYDKNTRLHSREQMAMLQASIRENGFVNPVLLGQDEGGRWVIMAGHARSEAARQLGLETIPVIRLHHLSDAQRRAYVIADNRLAELATWDLDMLQKEMQDILAEGVGLESMGFTETTLADLIGAINSGGGGGGGLTDADDAPQLPYKATTRLGDVWMMGGHRVICGDSTDATVVSTVLAGVKPNLMVTDPPYGVEYEPEWRGTKDDEKGKSKGAKAPRGAVLNDARADWREAWELFPGNIAYVWHGMRHAGVVFDSLVSKGFEIRAEIVWVKDQHILSRGHYHPQHESAWYGVRGKGADWNGDRKQSTVWKIDKVKAETGHGTQKPVLCMQRPIENNTSPGQAVYDPFCGSGTTVIAAQASGRVCYAVELHPGYVDVIVRRWQDYTGQPAVLENSGATFAEVEAERRDDA